MILYIVRHGKPDYEHNCLLPEGREQAEAVCRRLLTVGMDRIYSSPYGRAIETAQPLADALGLPVNIEPWSYELEDESRGQMPSGEWKHHSRFAGSYFHQAAYQQMGLDEGLEKVSIFTDPFRERYETLANGIDDLLSRNGYQRTEDGLYLPTAPNEDHIALFCHGGMMRVLLSHIFHLPYHLICGTLQVDFTGVSTLYFGYGRDGGEGALEPLLFNVGDIGHLYAQGQCKEHYNLHVKY